MKKEKFREEVLNVDVDGVQVSSVLSPDGRFEFPDPTPMEPPIGYKEPPDITTMIRQMVRNELFRATVDAAGYETFEEADDFDIEDDPIDPLTPYEKVFEAPAPARAGAGVDGGGAVKPTTDAAPKEVSKPDVLPDPKSIDQKGSGTSGNGSLEVDRKGS